jgi:hypothetical protein
VKTFKFRALLTLDPPGPGRQARQYPSGTHSLMIHVGHVGKVPCDKYFPAVIVRDAEEPLSQGESAVVTVTVVDEDADLYLDAGQTFTIWGGCGGHGRISRRVFTDSEPS